MKRKSFIIGSAVIVFVLIIAFFIWFDDLFVEYVFLPSEHIKPDTSLAVKVTRLRVLDYSDYITCYGIVESKKNMEMTARVDGTVSAVYFKPGDHVKKGQVIIDIKNDIVKQTASSSIISYFKAVREQKALRNISGKGSEFSEDMEDVIDIILTVPDSELKNTLEKYISRSNTVYPPSELLMQEAALMKSIENLRALKVCAPFDCIITDINAFEGKTLRTGDNIIGCYSPSELQIKADVSAVDFFRLKVGQNALYTNIFGEEEYLKAKVNAVSNRLQSKNSFACFLDVAEQGGLLPGMQVKAFIETEIIKDTLAVPSICISSTRDRSYVFVVRDNEAVWTDIETGSSNFAYTHIISGLKPGDLVIYEGHWTLSHQAKVKITDEKDIMEFSLLR